MLDWSIMDKVWLTKVKKCEQICVFFQIVVILRPIRRST